MTSCPWCGNPSEKLYIKVKDYFLTQEEFEIFECDHCHLLFTTPRPTPDKIGEYYKSDEYYSHQQNTKGFIPRIYEFVKSFNIKHKVNLALKDLPQGRLLDIGCGVGDFLLEVKNKGWQIVGIEPSDDAKTIAQQRLGIRPHDPAESKNMDDASFDVITLWHVLEHVDDLKSQISELYRLLKPNGRLIIALPNYQSFDSQYYKDKWAAWDVPRHLNHFSKDTLCSILTESNFQYIDCHKLKWDGRCCNW